MILYAARKYATNTLVLTALLTLLPVMFGSSLTGILPSALFWGSAGAAGYTYWRFRKKKIWPLYDNLRVPRLALLGGLFLSVQPLTLALSILL